MNKSIATDLEIHLGPISKEMRREKLGVLKTFDGRAGAHKVSIAQLTHQYANVYNSNNEAHELAFAVGQLHRR